MNINQWIEALNLPEDTWTNSITLSDLDEWENEIILPGDPPKTKDDTGRDKAEDLPRCRIM